MQIKASYRKLISTKLISNKVNEFRVNHNTDVIDFNYDLFCKIHKLLNEIFVIENSAYTQRKRSLRVSYSCLKSLKVQVSIKKIPHMEHFLGITSMLTKQLTEKDKYKIWKFERLRG